MGSYETGWRAVRGLLGATCLGEPAATIVLFALSWGSALEMLPSLDLAPNPKSGGPGSSPSTLCDTASMRRR